MAIEIVDFPSYKMVIFYSYVKLPEGIGNNNPIWRALIFFRGVGSTTNQLRFLGIYETPSESQRRSRDPFHQTYIQ